MKRLEAHHRFGHPVDETMVLLKDIVEILDLFDSNYSACSYEFQDRVDSLSSGQIGSALVNDNFLRNAVG